MFDCLATGMAARLRFRLQLYHELLWVDLDMCVKQEWADKLANMSATRYMQFDKTWDFEMLKNDQNFLKNELLKRYSIVIITPNI